RVRPVAHGPALSHHLRRAPGRSHSGSLPQPPPRQLSIKATMKPFNRKLMLSLVSTAFAASYTLTVRGNAITLTPASPSVLAGQTLALTVNGAVTPASIAV